MLAHKTHDLISGIKKARLNGGDVNQSGGEVSLTNCEVIMPEITEKTSVIAILNDLSRHRFTPVCEKEKVQGGVTHKPLALNDVRTLLVRHLMPLSYNDQENHWEKMPSKAAYLNNDGNVVSIKKRKSLHPAKGWQKQLERFSEQNVAKDGTLFRAHLDSLFQHLVCAEGSECSQHEAWSYGFLLGEHFIAIDCDLDDDAMSAKILQLFREKFPQSPIRSRGGSRWATILYLTDDEKCDMRGMTLTIIDNKPSEHANNPVEPTNKPADSANKPAESADNPDESSESKKSDKPQQIEVLGRGKQLVVHGWHPSGAQYFWYGGNLLDIQHIQTDELTLFLTLASDTLITQCGVMLKKDQPPRRVSMSWKGKNYGCGQDGLCNEDIDFLSVVRECELNAVPEHLRTSEHYLDEDDKCIYLICPNHTKHTGWGGDEDKPYVQLKDTAYIKDGGGFKCFHAGCANTDLKTYYLKNFVPPLICRLNDLGMAETTAVYVKDGNGNREFSHYALRGWKASDVTITMMLEDIGCSGVELRFDNFTQNVYMKLHDKDAPEFAAIRDVCQDDNFIPIPKSLHMCLSCRLIKQGVLKNSLCKQMEQAINCVADKHRFDQVVDYFKSITPEHDGITRIDESFWERYFSIQIDDEHGDDLFPEGSVGHSRQWLRAVAQYMWTAFYARATCTNPDGVKTDVAVVLTGKTGIAKSTFCECLAGRPQWKNTYDFGADATDRQTSLKGHLVMEIEELGNMGKRSVNEIKSVLSGKVDQYRLFHTQILANFVRRCIFIITTNDSDFLRDVTGNRRFAVIDLEGGDFRPHIDEFIRDYPQLLAEAKALYETNGVMYQGLSVHQEQVNAEYMADDPWTVPVSRYLEDKQRLDGSSDLVDILYSVLGMEHAKQSGREMSRLKGILIKLGWAYKQHKENGKNIRYWSRNGEKAAKPKVVANKPQTLFQMNGKNDLNILDFVSNITSVSGA